MLAVVATLFVSMVGLLYWQWLKNPPPTALLFVEATAAYDGATVTLDSEGKSDARRLSAANKYSELFRLQPQVGGYRITVRAPHPEQNVAVPLPPMKAYQYLKLSLGLPTSRPAP